MTVLIERDERVALMCATRATLDAEEKGGAALAALLGVLPASVWPPEHNDRAIRDWQRGIIAANPGGASWVGWYIVADGRLVGTCGYHGPPDAAGVVEVGYSVVPDAQRRGFATAAVRLLVARAFRDPAVTCIVAETLPVLVASQRVLDVLGFVQTGNRIDDELGEVVRYELPRGSARQANPRAADEVVA